MSGIGVKYAVRRFQPSAYSRMESEGVASLSPVGQEQLFDDWKDVVKAADTIVGSNDLQMGVAPNDPVVIKHNEDVILIYMKLDI